MPRHAASRDAHDTTDTKALGPAEQPPGGRALVDAWAKTLEAAEAMHVCLHPTYVRHSESELIALVEQALHDRRGPSQMVAEMLAQGGRSLARIA